MRRRQRRRYPVRRSDTKKIRRTRNTRKMGRMPGTRRGQGNFGEFYKCAYRGKPLGAWLEWVTRRGGRRRTVTGGTLATLKAHAVSKLRFSARCAVEQFAQPGGAGIDAGIRSAQGDGVGVAMQKAAGQQVPAVIAHEIAQPFAQWWRFEQADDGRSARAAIMPAQPADCGVAVRQRMGAGAVGQHGGAGGKGLEGAVGGLAAGRGGRGQHEVVGGREQAGAQLRLMAQVAQHAHPGRAAQAVQVSGIAGVTGARHYERDGHVVQGGGDLEMVVGGGDGTGHQGELSALSCALTKQGGVGGEQVVVDTLAEHTQLGRRRQKGCGDGAALCVRLQHDHGGAVERAADLGIAALDVAARQTRHPALGEPGAPAAAIGPGARYKRCQHDRHTAGGGRFDDGVVAVRRADDVNDVVLVKTFARAVDQAGVDLAIHGAGAHPLEGGHGRTHLGPQIAVALEQRGITENSDPHHPLLSERHEPCNARGLQPAIMAPLQAPEACNRRASRGKPPPLRVGGSPILPAANPGAACKTFLIRICSSPPAATRHSPPAVQTPGLDLREPPQLKCTAQPPLEYPAPPALERPALPAPEHPALPALEHPALPALEHPALPALEHPALPALEHPALPALEHPALPALEHPALPALERPALPALEYLALPALEYPAPPALEYAALPALEHPALPAPEHPALPAPEHPALPAPEHPALPTLEHPALPRLESPPLPALESPALPPPDYPALAPLECAAVPPRTPGQLRTRPASVAGAGDFGSSSRSDHCRPRPSPPATFSVSASAPDEAIFPYAPFHRCQRRPRSRRFCPFSSIVTIPNRDVDLPQLYLAIRLIVRCQIPHAGWVFNCSVRVKHRPAGRATLTRAALAPRRRNSMNAPIHLVPRVEPFFYDVDPGTRFCLYHAPDPEVASRGAMLYIHPFAEELNLCRRMAAQQARAFAAMGFAVLQIDLFGCGDSCGEFADGRWEHWRRDLAVAARWLAQREPGPLYLWGVRLGALLAMEMAAERKVEGLVLWQPLISGRTCINQFLRQEVVMRPEDLAAGDLGRAARAGIRHLRAELAARGRIDVAGYELDLGLARSIEAVEATQLELQPCTVHWFSSSAMPRRLSTRWDGANIVLHYHHVEPLPFWSDPARPEGPALLAATTAAFEGGAP